MYRWTSGQGLTRSFLLQWHTQEFIRSRSLPATPKWALFTPVHVHMVKVHVIGLSVCCCHRHKKRPDPDLSELQRRLSQIENGEKQAWLGQESNCIGHTSYNRFFSVCHTYQPYPQLTMTLCFQPMRKSYHTVSQLAQGVGMCAPIFVYNLRSAILIVLIGIIQLANIPATLKVYLEHLL